MGRILASFVMPHPPIIVPEVGNGEEVAIAKTARSMDECAQRIAELRPDDIIIITPHGPVFRDAMALYYESSISGHLGSFRAPQVKISYDIDKPLTMAIADAASRYDITCALLDGRAMMRYGIDDSMDHGALVPLYFIEKRYHAPHLVHITYGFLSYEEIYAFGKAVQQAVEESDKNVVIIASGDLSHKLTPDSPNGYTPLGKEFDEKLLDLLSKSDVEGIVRMDKRFIEEAAECGMRSIIAMLGALDGYEFSANVLSHEGPFGVGYGVVAVEVGNRSKGRELLDSVKAKHFADMKHIRDGEDPYVALARQTVETYIRQGKVIKPGKDLPDEMFTKKAGVFVSIHKNGELRGCIGTISPVYENVASEIIHNAISASTRDPRFEPIEENELDVLEYSVDVLNPAEPVDSIEELDPKRYGVIVRRGYRSGLLLPDLEGVDTPQQQLSIALQKAGIRPDEPYTIERFTVERHK